MARDIKKIVEDVKKIKKELSYLSIQDQHMLKQVVGNEFGLADKNELKESILDIIQKEKWVDK